MPKIIIIIITIIFAMFGITYTFTETPPLSQLYYGSFSASSNGLCDCGGDDLECSHCLIKPIITGRGPLSESQRDILTKYKKFKLPEKAPTFKEFCYPIKMKLQVSQALVGEIMAPHGNKPKNLMVFHRIGAGKTCAAISIAEKWIGRSTPKHAHGRPLILLPASLEASFRNELRGFCSTKTYITPVELNTLHTLNPNDIAYRNIIKASDMRIDNDYQILSYNKFLTQYKRLIAPIIIIDEFQNINNIKGAFYNAILNFYQRNPTMNVVIMSATPIFDNIGEFEGIYNLLRIPWTYTATNSTNTTLTPANIKKDLGPHISYYAGAPPSTFPTTEIHIVKCKMSAFQAKWYHSEIEHEISSRGHLVAKQINNSFYIKSRQRANIVYPNGLIGAEGLQAMTSTIWRDSLDTYSCKFAKLIKKLTKGQLSFIYSSFTSESGIASLTQLLNVHGYKNFATHGAGPKRYAIWSGAENIRQKDTIRALFNSTKNDDGSQIQIIIGSPAIKEGVSLMRIRAVHIIEPYWNHSRLAQIFGRAVRFCSHKTLRADQRNVNIYIYVAYAININDIDPNNSIDLLILALADEKRRTNEPYIKAMIDGALDKGLLQPKK